MTANRSTSLSVLAIAVAAAVLVATAFTADPYRTPELKLHDAGVWVSRSTDANIGRTNTQIAEIDIRVKIDAAPDFTLFQADEHVLVHDPAAGSVIAVDGRTAQPREPVAAVPPASQVGLAGPEGRSSSTAAVLTPTGELWVMPPAQLLTTTMVQAEGDDGARDEPSATLPGATSLAVGLDGVAHVVVPAEGKVRSFNDAGAEVGSTDVGELAEDHDLQLTSVGARPVVLDSTDGVLVLPGGRRVDLAEHGGSPRVQQPGPSNGRVLVATDGALLAVGLDDGAVEVVSSEGSGTPAAPVHLRGCAWAAWSGTPMALSACTGTDVRVMDLPDMRPGAPLVFRTNRGKLVINELETGTSYVLGEGDPEQVDWSKAILEEEEQDDQAEEQQEQRQERDPEQKPPVAVDDVGPEGFGTRPDRAVVINPLRNDWDPNDDVLVIESVQALSPETARVDLVQGGLALQVTPPAGAIEPVTFEYTVNDGAASASARAEVVIRDPSENTAPACSFGEPQETFVAAGASVTHNVIAEARDADGDTIVLATPVVLDSVLGTLTADPDGTIIYRSPGIGFVGRVDIPFRLEDDFGGATECSLAVNVQDAATNDPPTVRNDHAAASVGEEVVVDVLANDSDANGDELRVTGATPLGQYPGATFTTDDAGRVRVTSTVPGTLMAEYRVTDGPNEGSALLRVDVRERPTQAPPIAVRDDVILRPSLPAVVDVLANDVDPNGDVLVVQSVDVPAGANLAVEVLERRFLRISTADGGLLPATAQFTYTVSDGTGQSAGTVVVRPGPSTAVDQPPNAVDDTFTIRAGTVAALPVLANDSDPEGGRLLVRIEGLEAQQEPGVAERVFVQQDHLRFIAPPTPGTFRVAYQAVDPAGYAASAFAVVHVVPAETANKAPEPEDLVARGVSGEDIRIRVPIATMDPDGDTVTLLGIGERGPANGSVIAVENDQLVYRPDTYDRNADGVPDGFFGTDTFSYRVRDSQGAEAAATVRVGVAPPPLRNSPPVAIDDQRGVAEGGTLLVDVVRNDSDPDGDELWLDVDAGLGLPEGAAFRAAIEDGRIRFDAGSLAAGDTADVTYTVTDGILTDRGRLSITVTADTNQPPIARDDAWSPTAPGETVTIPVLDNDGDVDGERDDLRVVAVDSPGTVVDDGRAVAITMGDADVLAVYTVEDGAGARSKAVVSVPVLDDVRRRPVAVYDEVTIPAGGTARVDVLANDLVSPGTSKVLFEAGGNRGGTCSIDGSSVVFQPAPDLVGTGGCSYLMGDGPGDDPTTLRATGMVGVVVEAPANTPPRFIEQPLRLRAGGELTVDLRHGVRDVDEGHEDGARFSDLTGEAQGISGSFDGSRLTVRATNDVLDGTNVVLTFTVTDPDGGVAQGRVTVTVSKFVGALATVVPDTARTFQDVPTAPIPVLTNDQVGEDGGPLRIVEPVTAEGGTVSVQGDSIIFTPTPGFFGETTFPYVVEDSTAQAERRVTGTVTVTVVGRPSRPPAPSVVRENRAITLSWGVPSPNGAPITEYVVRANGPGGGERRTSANTLRFDGLTNGAEYTFQIAAINEAVTAALASGALAEPEFSDPSPVIVPNEKPPTPAAPTAVFDPAGGAIDVSWTDPGGEGTAVQRYLLEVSPPPAGGGQIRIDSGGSGTRKITGLTNGVPYTFRIKAFNVIQADVEGESEWSLSSSPETPAKPPEAPSQPRIVEQGDRSITVGWDAAEPNGDPISAYVVEVSRDGVVQRESGELPAGQRTLRIDSDNGPSFTFRVKAKNKAGFGGYSSSSPTAVSFGVPGPVPGVSATEGDGSSVVTVQGSVNANGNAIKRWEYRVAVNGGGFGNWSEFGGSGSTVPAQNGASHVFQVRGCNDRGCAEDPGASSNPVTPFGAPLAPVVNGSVSGTSINWSWSSTGDNGRPITAWEYSLDGGGWTPTTATGFTSNHGHAETHTLQVRGVNQRGPGGIGQAQARTVDPPGVNDQIQDAVLDGTWMRSDPNNGNWYSSDSRPPNAVGDWQPNGTGVTVTCTRAAASYNVNNNGRPEMWNWWARLTNGSWVPTAVLRPTSNGPYPGVVQC